MSEGTDRKPVADRKKNKIAQIGIVVADAAKTARRYSEIFGIGPWMFLDLTATDAILHGKPLGDAEGCVRTALASFKGIEIELLQPLYGPGTHMEFFRKHGEGIHHVSFGMIDNHDEVVAALRNSGIGIEMQGTLGGAIVFSYMDTVEELGTIFEVVKPPASGVVPAIEPWGLYTPPAPPLLNMETKRIVQIGLVVGDAEGMAKRYEELFGIGPWTIVATRPPRVPPAGEAKPSAASKPKGILHDIPMITMDIRLKIALADCGDMQIELIEPLAGPGTHWEFLKRQGQGVHHLSFGAVDDHDRSVALLKEQGIGIEMSGGLGRGAVFSYMATQKELATVFEFVHVPPGVEIKL
ncbi:MAG: VOC family protein [Deltaproteobacteria bacterium]|nr:VOC family protein [Deltaproteobacteria bacterium]